MFKGLWGVSAAMQRALADDGISLIGRLAARYGRIGARLGRLARGEDARAVVAHAPTHSISAETTLGRDEADAERLANALWPLCERLSARLKQASRATGTITLRLKTADFRLRTRSPPPRRSDPAGRDLVSHRFYLTRQRSRQRHPVSADRSPGRQAHRPPRGRSPDPV
jgi:DNA polymerase-4